jgi:hypothetical protein
VPVSSNSLKSLETRRLLLSAEADIHRARLGEELAGLTANIHQIQASLKSFSGIFSILTAISRGFSAFRQLRTSKKGWFSRILAGAGLASSVWMAAKNRSRSFESDSYR